MSRLLKAITTGVTAFVEQIVANGSDNIGIYVFLFASSNLVNLLLIIGVFFLLVGVWYYAAYKLDLLHKSWNAP
jgi:cadmium resistance protein CadD (predicted permease)